MALTLGELVGFLDLDDTRWNKGMQSAKGTVDGFITFSHQRFGLLALTVARFATQVTGAVSVLSGVGATAATASGSLLLLPAALTAVKITAFAAKIGVEGFSDALAEEDPAAFAEAVAQMPPAMRDAAIAARGFQDDWDGVKDSVQQALWDDAADTIEMLGSRYMPLLKSGLTDVASGFENAHMGIRVLLMEAQSQQDVQSIFGNTADAVEGVSLAARPIVQIFRDIATVGSEFLPGMATGFAESADAAAAFISNARETGQLHDWISGGLSTLGQLWQLLQNVAGIVSAVFGAFDTAGASSLDLLVELTGKLRDFLQSAQGQSGLRALATTLATVADVAFEVAMTALEQLLPAVETLLPVVGDLAVLFGGVLVEALQIAGPILAWLAEVFAANVEWLGPLALGLYAGAQAFNVVAGAMRIVQALAMVNPWLLLVAATVALVTLIVTYWDEIVAALGVAWDWIVGAAQAAWDWVVGIISGAIDWIVDAFMSWTLPGLIATHWDSIVGFFRNAVRWCLDAVDWLRELPGKVVRWFGQAKDWAVNKLIELVSWVRGLPGRILSALGNIGSLLLNAGRDLVMGLIRGIGNMAGAIWDKLVGIVSDAWNGVLNFLGIASPSRLALWAGQMVGEGLAQGLLAEAATVAAASDELSAAIVLPEPRSGDNPTGYGPDGFPPGFGPDDGFGGPMVGGQRALVHIENYQPPADAPADKVAADLDWFSRGGG